MEGQQLAFGGQRFRGELGRIGLGCGGGNHSQNPQNEGSRNSLGVLLS